MQELEREDAALASKKHSNEASKNPREEERRQWANKKQAKGVLRKKGVFRTQVATLYIVTGTFVRPSTGF